MSTIIENLLNLSADLVERAEKEMRDIELEGNIIKRVWDALRGANDQNDVAKKLIMDLEDDPILAEDLLKFQIKRLETLVLHVESIQQSRKTNQEASHD